MEQEKSFIGETNFILLDIYETEENFIVEAEVPGVDPSGIDVYMSGNTLVIKGTKSDKVEAGGDMNFFCMERCFGPFKRTIDIPVPINTNAIEAKYNNGLLIVYLPKSVERRVRNKKITINKDEVI